MKPSEYHNYDKIQHFVGGFAIAGLSRYFIGRLGAILLVIVIAALKEYWDSKRPDHTPDWQDFIATVNGGVLAIIL